MLDERGLKSIETISGQVVWHAHSHEERKSINNLEFPVALPDLNNDNVNELLAIYQRNNLMVICGHTGRALLNIIIKTCPLLHDLLIQNNNIIFNCLTNDNAVYKQITIDDVRRKYHNSSYDIQLVDVAQHGFTDDSNNNNKKFSIGNRELIINNSGNCPNCNANIELLDKTTMKKKIWPYSNAYIMTPKSFQFQSSQTNLKSFKGHINGFIIKIWQWHDTKTRPTATTNDNSSSNGKNDTYFINLINEKIILITFNETSVYVINASLAEIHQLCWLQHIKNERICQPTLENQIDSILVADLDQDGSQELISYSSTYTIKDNNDNNRNRDEWQLISNIKVIRLEAELPKLYEEK